MASTPAAAPAAYYHGDESTQFTYFRIPRQLITSPRFKPLSSKSKLLYSILLDHMCLSIKNEWYDADGRVYIYYTVDEICSTLNCGRDKAMKLLAELDTSKGIGLVERIKQGQGKPTRIYVLRFTTGEIPPQDVQKSCYPTPAGRAIRCADSGKTDESYNNIKQTKQSYTDPSINPCQRQFEIVRKRRRNFVVFRRGGGNKIKRLLAGKEC